jgi:hypothetical protein
MKKAPAKAPAKTTQKKFKVTKKTLKDLKTRASVKGGQKPLLPSVNC